MEALYYIVAAVVFTAVVAFVYIFYSKGNTKKTRNDFEYINSLVSALGGITNINNVNVENRRLKIELVKVKDVNQKELKELVKGAFLNQNNVTIITSGNASDIVNEIKLMKK